MYDMFVSVEANYGQLYEVLKSVKAQYLLSFPVLFLEKLCDIIQSLKEYTLLLERTTTPNIHFPCQIIKCIYQLCEHYESDIDIVKHFKKNLLLKVQEKIVPALSSVHYIASILNPLTRDETYIFDNKTQTNREKALNELKKYYELLKITLKQDADNNNNNLINDNEKIFNKTFKNDEECIVEHEMAIKKRKLTSSSSVLITKNEETKDDTKDDTNACCDQLQDYMSMNIVKQEAILYNDDPIMFWRENEKRLNVLAVVSKYIFSIQASSSASESVFSTAGYLICDKRTSMKYETISRLLFLNSIKGILD